GDSAKTANELAVRANILPSSREKRRVRALAGAAALGHGDTRRAIAELTQAEAMLPPRTGGGGPLVSYGPQVPIWFALGSAHVAAGTLSEAAARFEKIVDTGRARVYYPVEFIRSLYSLGQIYERSGDRDKAASYYRQFLQYWGDGDI